MAASPKLGRRRLLSATGAAIGSGAITGFPAIHAQEPKVLRYLGTAVNEGDDIAKKCFADTAVKTE